MSFAALPKEDYSEANKRTFFELVGEPIHFNDEGMEGYASDDDKGMMIISICFYGEERETKAFDVSIYLEDEIIVHHTFDENGEISRYDLNWSLDKKIAYKHYKLTCDSLN